MIRGIKSESMSAGVPLLKKKFKYKKKEEKKNIQEKNYFL